MYTSEEALAFILAHEMSHLILGHGLRQEYLGLELTQLHKNYKRAKTNSEKIAIYIRIRSIYFYDGILLGSTSCNCKAYSKC
ncbi:MAG: M48 family metalloprotease [Candidatus Gastranaerophilaceae bacterium]